MKELRVKAKNDIAPEIDKETFTFRETSYKFCFEAKNFEKRKVISSYF